MTNNINKPLVKFSVAEKRNMTKDENLVFDIKDVAYIKRQ